MTDHGGLPIMDPERAHKLLAVAYQATGEVLGLQQRLQRALDRGELAEAQSFNDGIFVLMDDLRQRFESAIREAR